MWLSIYFPKDLSVRLFAIYSTHICASNGVKFVSVAINCSSNLNSAKLKDDNVVIVDYIWFSSLNFCFCK